MISPSRPGPFNRNERSLVSLSAIRNDVTGAILAGGRSSRMGTDKALLSAGGEPFIGRVAGALHSVLREVMIISDHSGRYDFLNLPVFPDYWPSCGPLAGIHSALVRVTTRKVLACPCDLPDVTPALFESLISARTKHPIVIASQNDNVQPLCGIYDVSLIPLMEGHLKRGQRSVRVFIEEAGALTVRFDADPPMLTNLNTPSDYISFCRAEPSTTNPSFETFLQNPNATPAFLQSQS